jgi:hypothetical protein
VNFEKLKEVILFYGRFIFKKIWEDRRRRSKRQKL